MTEFYKIKKIQMELVLKIKGSKVILILSARFEYFMISKYLKWKILEILEIVLILKIDGIYDFLKM